MRLDIYISTDVLSPRPREGTFRSTWIGYGSRGQKVGEDGTIESAFGNQYGLLVMALREAAEHINQNARPEIRICCKNGLIIQGVRNLRTWEKRGFRKANGQPLSHADDWRFISEKLKGLFYRVEGGTDGSQQVGNS